MDKMNIIFVVIPFAIFASICAVPAGQYTTKYDDLDANNLIKNDRLMMVYLKCLLDKGKCTPEGRELKSVLADALETDCIRCSERQKMGAEIIIRHLLKNKRDWWNQLESKYDPNRKYVTKYDSVLRAQGIAL